MKIDKLSFCFLIIIFFTTSILNCSIDKKTTSNKKIEIKVNLNKQKKIKLSSFVDSIAYVPLETTENCLIGNIDKIRILNYLIFILDKRQNKIFIFNTSGNFQYSICHIGRGPGEYLSISDFCIDPDMKHIIIADHLTRRFIFYDLKGKFQFTKESRYINKFCEFYKNTIIYYSDNYILDKYNLHLFNIGSGKNSNYLSINPALKDFQSGDGCQFYFNYRNQLLFKEALGQEIYRINNNDPEEYLSIDFGGKNMPENYFKENIPLSDQLYDLNKGRYAFHVTNFLELKEIIYFTFDYNFSQYSCIYNKGNTLSEYGYITNDIDFTPFGNPMFSDGSSIFSFIDAPEFLSVIDQIKEHNDNTKIEVLKLIKISKSINISCNPILIKYLTK